MVLQLGVIFRSVKARTARKWVEFKIIIMRRKDDYKKILHAGTLRDKSKFDQKKGSHWLKGSGGLVFTKLWTGITKNIVKNHFGHTT